jgi:hypothetical protein
VLENRPAAVYFPTHVEGMEMAGMGSAGDYRFGLMYSYPHRFWNVNGEETQMTGIESSDDVHLMATVWDPETGTVLPDTGLTVEVSKGGELVTQEVIYPMLSQPMGFHYGANFGLDGDEEYTVTVSVGGMSTRRTGAFEERFGEPASADIAFEYSQSRRDEITFERTMDRAGERAARSPMMMGGGGDGGMDMDGGGNGGMDGGGNDSMGMDGGGDGDMGMTMPLSILPTAEELPGTTHGTATIADGRFVVQSLESPPEGVDGGGAYLYVSARTPYNRMVLPAMGLAGRLERGGETVFEGELVRTLDPEAAYHYGAAVPSVESGDALTLSMTTPPQVARHEGYETAFMETGEAALTLK